MPPTITPILNDPRTYVENKGIVEIHYGVENSTVEWQTDLFDYVRNDMREGMYSILPNKHTLLNRSTPWTMNQK